MKIKKDNEKFYEDIIKEVKEDFEKRQAERRSLELSWELNMNFLNGSQNTSVSARGEIENEDKNFYWQSQNTYNHIAPIIEARLAKLSRVRPVMSVRAASDEDKDLKIAKISTSILNSAYNRLELDRVIYSNTVWSEVCGSSFYKIIWEKNAGRKIGVKDGTDIYEGDAAVIACPPHEIFPDSLFTENIEDCKSIIHARAMHVNEIEELYGVTVQGGEVNVFTLDNNAQKSSYLMPKVARGVKSGRAVVLERYEKPCAKYKNGRLIITAGDKMLYMGDLPYKNGGGENPYPFIKQSSLTFPSLFFGRSMVERLIPIQKAYNLVKNRKHEFLNRLATGVLAVEDGSIDTDDLIEDGLPPGKVIVYRQGSRPPILMNPGSVPVEFTYEEERLLKEFMMISGVSEFMRNSIAPANINSGIALSMLIEQDDTRLSSTAENIRRCVKSIGKHILSLFKQFSGEKRYMRMAGEGKKVEVFYFSSNDISSDDIIFDTENELTITPAQKKSMVFDLLGTGLLNDENGKLNNRMRAKVLEILGFGGLENTQDITSLHIARAQEENLYLLKNGLTAEEYDDHETHISEHTRYILSSEYASQKNDINKKRFTEHIRSHKQMEFLEKPVTNLVES